MPSLSKTRRLEGDRRVLGFSGRFLLVLAAGPRKSLMFKSDNGFLSMVFMVIIICANSR